MKESMKITIKTIDNVILKGKIEYTEDIIKPVYQHRDNVHFMAGYLSTYIAERYNLKIGDYEIVSYKFKCNLN